MATGDYSTDKEMLACYCPEALQYVGYEQGETDYNQFMASSDSL